MKFSSFFLFSFLLLINSDSYGQVDARLFQYPDVSDTHIAFSYGGDIWLADKNGGDATRLTSAKGNETFAKFSPDGSQIAFSGNYDGNSDIYVMDVKGSVPKRVTHHGMMDRLLDWYPDGKSLLFVNSSESGKQRFSQFYSISPNGGIPKKLPMAYGEFGNLSPDASKIAFTDRSRIFRTWKRYRGGTASDVWIFDLTTLESENITANNANDELPMWVGDKIYFLSDQGTNQRFNIWSYNTITKTSKQITNHSDYDVHFPSNSEEDIVYEAGGKIYLLNLSTEVADEIKIRITSDMITLKERKESVESYIQSGAISPDGNRAVIQARGEIFSLPAEKGVVTNLTRSTGVAERSPAWSPNGKYIAYWSDKSGEYELTVRDMTKGGKEEQLTNLGPGFRYQLYWSPDSKKLSFVDQTMTIWVYDMTLNTPSKVDQDIFLFEGGLRNWSSSWSPDSDWLAYSKVLDNGNNAIFFYHTKAKSSRQVTSGFYSDMNPTFGPDGKYLYLITNRSFVPVYSDFDNTWSYPNATQLALVPLTKEIESPLAAENDTVAVTMEKEKKDKKGKSKEKDEDSKDDEKVKKTKITLNGFERRMIILPPKAGNMGALSATKDKVLFQRYSNSGSGERKTNLIYFDLEEKEEKTIMSDIRRYRLSANGEKVLIQKNEESMGIVEVAPDQELEETLPLKEMVMTVNPREEWKQIFNDSWRFQRDFFYDTKMHGVDWDQMRTQYGDMINYAMNRNDVNFILGELIGELNASHTYRGGGDRERADQETVGYLGVDWNKMNGKFRIDHIVRGADWDSEVRSPLDEPGIDINEGDYILAVNGISLEEYADPWAAFAGFGDKTVELTYSKTPSWNDAKTAVVKTLDSETRLRNLEWIEQNRKRVDEASGGKIGYIYVPNTGVSGQNELVRQFYGQWNKEGLIIDERFNSGGQIPDRFIELLNRKPMAYWDVRDGKNWQWPPVANFGSMAMLINGWAGSGGDAFPDYFRKAGLGPLIGGRTWGGLIGISGAPTLIDGGGVTVPTFRMYNPDGTWFKEGHGVEPDIEVLEDPTQLAKGIDTQLEKAIEEVMKSIIEKGPIHPKVPLRENRSRPIRP